jgi:acetylglutamate kinase
MKQIADLIKSSVICGGMLPKLEACQEALRRGVGRVRILPASEVNLLPDFYTCKIECGTEVMVA